MGALLALLPGTTGAGSVSRTLDGHARIADDALAVAAISTLEPGRFRGVKLGT
jgi:hypothetical protein